MPALGMLDLPTEILLIICDCVEDESLFHLALLSRRLNYIALRTYFVRRSVDFESESGVLCTLNPPAKRDVLSAMQISLSIQSLERVIFSIPHSSSDPAITPFFRNTKRLETFVSRLTSVKKVSLRLGTPEKCASISLRSGDELGAWSAHVGNALNGLIQCGCQYLSIIDYSAIESGRPGLMNRLVRRVARRSSSIPLVPAFPSGPFQLTTLVLDSATFLASPGIDWVLAALRQAPVTRLALAMHRENPHPWGDTLLRFATAAPGLTSLFLGEVPLSIETEVLSTLDHFCNLTELHISCERRLPSSRTRTPAPRPCLTLRHVTTLSVASDLAEHLLTPKDALPELHSLSVTWRARPGLNLSSLFISLATIAAKLYMYPSVLRLSLDIEARRWRLTAEDILSVPTELIMQPDIVVARELVRSLTLRLDVEASDLASIARLAEWFTDICMFSLFTREKTIPESAITSLLRAVKPTRWLEEIKVNGEGRPLGGA
ncbi:hypothetical protein MSAN_01704300 [Mycena sanguinolenta]|uniref:F-box domain-containing protein n=1 Tax=Mycena sanguinolenta TaxID=230812 RepID=A0A8H6Y064_9AGAR|nr:hypothetical protein MSAN_01704300 [Mycena sanguinolenta]